MRRDGLIRVVLGIAVAGHAALNVSAQESAPELTEFTSQSGKFRIELPGEPQYEETAVGEAQEPQHQFKIGSANGVYLISYQENPNLRGATPEQMAAALESGRDRLLHVFRGELLDSKAVKLDNKHPGLSFRLTIPAAQGEARCRFYLVGTRLYQVMAMGLPEFAASEEAAAVLNSFALLK